MVKNRLIHWWSAAGVVFAMPAIAQDSVTEAASAEPDTIVVEGLREKDKGKAVNAFVRQTTDASPYSPLPFYDPDDYCPAAVGLSAAADAAITARMFRVAQAAKVRPADPTKCTPSALVVFTDDTQKTITRFRKLHPEYFLSLTGERIDFQGMTGPVASWKILARMDRNGNPVLTDTNGTQIVESIVGFSRLESISRVVTAMSVLVIDKSAVRGLTWQQIADFAAMRSLVDRPAQNAGTGVAQSILSVVDAPIGGETPLSLTHWDLAYVKARYSVPRFSYSVRQMAEMRSKMKRSLSAADIAADRKN